LREPRGRRISSLFPRSRPLTLSANLPCAKIELVLHTQPNLRLLVVRLGAMGDILHALPAVTALRLAHPAWHIGWVVEPRWQALLKAEIGDRTTEIAIRDGAMPARDSAMPVVDRLHFASTRAWKRRPFTVATAAEINALRRELREERYDAVVDLQGAIRSAAIVRLAGCPRRIGEARPREWPAQWLFTERVRTRGAHVIEQDVELASAVAGEALTPAQPLLPFDPVAEKWCDEWLAASFAAEARPIALIAPGAGWGAKRWPPERYAVVAEGLKQRGFHVLANSGPGEEHLAATIVAGGAAVTLTTTLPQLIAVMRRVALCIAGDTGPLHLACALGRPVVGIYGPTDPTRNGPYGALARVLRSPGSRRDHKRRAAPDPGLLTIAPEDVLRAADELLAEVKG
jgi:heptosyltransferase-1